MNPSSTSDSSETTGPFPRTASGSTGALAEAKHALGSAAREAAAKLKSTASNAAAKAKEEVTQIAAEKKASSSGRIGGFSSALHDTADALEEKDPNVAWFTHRAADKLQGVADYLRTRDLPGLREDAEGIARRHPVLFFGGMFAAGLLLGNLVKASRRKLENQDDAFDGPRDAQGSWSTTAGHDDLAPHPAFNPPPGNQP